MRLKVKYDENRQTQLTVDSQCHWSSFLNLLGAELGFIPQNISKGYPTPKPLSFSSPDMPIADLGIRDGDTIVIPQAAFTTTTVVTSPSITSLVIREMLDDNSCLFSAVAYLLGHDRPRNPGQATEALEVAALNLRRLAASLVLSDPIAYTEAVLGMIPDEYAQWIINPQHWGGGIELAVFSNFFAIEFASIDVASGGRMDVFGESNGYSQRAYLLYTGIHYDALAMNISGKSEKYSDDDVTVFVPGDDAILLQALEIAELARAEHRYTDMARFSLQCDVCGVAIVGEREARVHATQTSHDRFTEYTGGKR